MSSKTRFIPFILILLTLFSCSDHDDPIIFTELQVTATENPIPVGFQTKLTATSFYSDGSTQLTDSTWESLDKAIATVDSNGLVTALTQGSVTIQATNSDGSGKFLLTVSDATITSIRLNPLFAEVPVGHNINYDAQGYFSDDTNHSINNHPYLIWVSEQPEVAIINKETGRSDTLTEGSTTITAVLNAKDELAQIEVRSNSVQLTVNSHVLQTIMITPERVTWPLGLTQPFIAMGVFSDGDTRDITDDVTWSSEVEGILMLMDGEVNGVFKGIAVGSSNVSATYNETLTSDITSLFVVEKRKLTNFTVDSASGAESQPLGKEVQFKAEAEFNDGNSYNVSGYKQVHWQSDDTSIATVTISGLVKGIKKGFVTIKATTAYDNVAAEKKIEITSAVIETIVIQPIDGNNIISVGNTQQFEAYGQYTDGTRAEYIELEPEFTWHVSTGVENPNGLPNNVSLPEVTFDDSGLLTYVSVGSYPGGAIISATLGDLTADTPALLLPLANVILVTPPSSSSMEFIGVLTKPEAEALNIKYSGVVYDNARTEHVSMTYNEAVEYCEQLLYNGNNDWQLPSSSELQALRMQVADFGLGWVYEKSYWSTTGKDNEHDIVSLVDSTITTDNDESLYYASCARTIQ